MAAVTAADHLRDAEACIRRGALGDAVLAYRASLAIDPAQPDAWFNLAWAQRGVRAFDAALESYQQAIARGVTQPEAAHVNRAAILSDHLARPDLAVIDLEQALVANPAFLPAVLNLGNLHEDFGEADPARLAYRRALSIAPGNGRAQARIGMIDIATGAAAGAVDRLTAALEAAASLEDRAEILFALGTALDATERYDDAFQAYEAANWIARSIAERQYDPAAQENLVDRLIAAYPAGSHDVVTVDGGDGGDGAPIFICGMFRSGSTLLEQILGRHSAITAAGELEEIPALARALAPYPEAATSLSVERIAELRLAYLRVAPGDGRITDKRCDNFLHIGLIKTLFPTAKIVHTRRNALDTFLSVYFLHFGEGVTYGHDLRDIAHFYLQYRRLMAHWRQVYPADIVDFDYEHLVAEPRDAVSALLQALGLPWEDACLAAEASPGSVRTASAWQVRRPLHARSSGRSRHYRAQLAEVAALLAQHGEQITP